MGSCSTTSRRRSGDTRATRPPEPSSPDWPGSPIDSASGARTESIRRNHLETITRLFERYHRSLVRVARLYVRNPLVAEEVAQEAWIGVLQDMDTFRHQSSVSTWIHSILVHKAITAGIRESRYVLCDRPCDRARPAATDGKKASAARRSLLSNGPAQSPSVTLHTPESDCLLRELTASINRTINTLPEKQRRTLLLREIHGCSTKEICTILGVTKNHQWVLLYRARRKLQESLREYCDMPRRIQSP